MSSINSTNLSVASTSPCAPFSLGHTFDDRNDSISVSIGAALTILSLISFCLAILVIFVILKSGNLTKVPIFILINWSLINSLLTLFLIGFFVGPSIYFRTDFLDDRKYGAMNFHIGQCLQASFLAGSLFQIIVAINRVLAFRHWKNIDRKVYNMIGSGVLALGFGLSYIQAFYFVCCPTYNHFQWFGPFRYNWVIELDEKCNQILKTYEDYGQPYINMPIYITATIVPTICYAYIFGYTFYLRSKMSGSHFSSEQRLEIVRSVQFASIFCFYTCFWVYEILLSYAGYFHIDFHFNCLPVFFLWIEATMNAVINATNKENRKVLFKLISYKSMPVNATSGWAINVTSSSQKDINNNHSKNCLKPID